MVKNTARFGRTNVPTPILSIVFFVIAALLGALGQFLYKEGAAAASKVGYFAYGTPIKTANVCGMLLLVVGMYLMGK